MNLISTISSGHRYGSLIVIDIAERWNGRTYWLCSCDCGKRASVLARDLVKGRVTACRRCAAGAGRES